MATHVLPSPSKTLPQPKYNAWEFSECFEDALYAVTSQLFAATTTIAEAPNPLFQIDGDDVGVPIPRIQMEDLRDRGFIARNERMGVEMIESKDLRIHNTGWKLWIQEKAKTLVKESFQIEGATMHLEFAFVVTDEAKGFEKHYSESRDPSSFGKLLVILPSSSQSTLAISTPNSEEIRTADRRPGETGSLTLAIWYHGAKPALASPGCLCLLYNLSVAPPHPYTPDQLTLPGECLGRPALMECLESWHASVRIGDPDYPTFLTWIFDNQYDTFEGVRGIDRARADMLLKAAKDLGFKAYFVSFQMVVEGRAEGWCDPEDDDRYYGRWDYGEPEDEADIDMDSHHFMVDGHDGIWKLQSWMDVRENRALHHDLAVASEDLVNEFDPKNMILPERDWTESGGGPRAIFEECYEPEDGSLVWTWKRSAFVMWPEERHAQTLVTLFSWKVGRLVEDPFQFPGERGLEDKTKAVETFLAHFSRPSDYQVPEFQACRRIFLETALEIGRQDLYTSTLEKFGVQGEKDAIKRALEKYPNTEFGNRVMTMCIEGQSTMKGKIEVAAYFFDKEPERIATFLRQSIKDIQISSVFSPEELYQLSLEVGIEFFQTELLPKVGAYENTTYWLRLLESFRSDPDTVKEYLPRVVGHHQVSFKPALPLATPVTHSSGHYPSSSNAWKSGTTFSLLHRVLETKDLIQVSRMLEKILAISPSDFPSREKSQCFITVLARIKEELCLANIPPNSHPAIPHFFQTFILKHILPEVGPAPSVPSPTAKTNWTLPVLECPGNAGCQCRPVSIFLVSPYEQTRTWKITKAARAHVIMEVTSRYSHSKNLLMKETQPRSRVGTLKIQKVGFSFAEKTAAWDQERASIQRSVGSFQDCLGFGQLPDMIITTMMKGSLGYTDITKRTAQELLAKPFPMAEDVGDLSSKSEAPTHPRNPIPTTGNAFLGYGYVYINDLTFDPKQQRPRDEQLVQSLLSSFRQNLNRVDPKNAIRVSISPTSLQDFSHSITDGTNPPHYAGISKVEPNLAKFVVHDGQHRILALKELLSHLGPEEMKKQDWWLAEIYDAQQLEERPEIGHMLRGPEATAAAGKRSVDEMSSGDRGPPAKKRKPVKVVNLTEFDSE